MYEKRRAARRRLARRALILIVAGVALVAVLVPTMRAVTASNTLPLLPFAAGTPTGPPAGPWHLTFEDDFSGQRLNTDKWQPNWLGGNDSATTNDVAGSYELSCFNPAQVSVRGGSLVLTALHKPCITESGATYQYDSGLVNTHSDYLFTYGYFEARIWLPTETCGSGDLAKPPATCISDFPTFWATEANASTPGAEIDVMEGLQGKPCFHFHDHASSIVDPDIGSCPVIGDPAGWHVYAANWEPGRVTFYYDGKTVGTITNPLIPSQPMYLVLSLGVPALWVDQTPDSLKVSYVRVWQR